MLVSAISENINLNAILRNVEPIVSMPYSLKAEDTYNFSMYCQNFSHQRAVPFDGLDATNLEILKMSETEVVWVSLFGSNWRSELQHY